MPDMLKHTLTPRQQRMFAEYKQRQQASRSVHHSFTDIDSIESLYNALCAHEEIKAKALLMLGLRSWLTDVSDFDPVTGHALYTGIVDLMDVVGQINVDFILENEIKDRIYRIVKHTKGAIKAVLENIREKILREHAMLPIHAAREVDSISVQWLSRQPGRTLREKLSGKPYIKAVRRRLSVDTSENRLFKAFLLRLERILIERQSAFKEFTSETTCAEMLDLLQRWLRSDGASEIGYWGNLPPNNTLLQDKRYRKIWDGWLWLQSLDENIAADNKKIHHDILCVIYWETLALLNQSERFRTVQQPVTIDYDNFSLSLSLPVKGYLFPIYKTKLRGRIKTINYEKKYGFLIVDNSSDLFFHRNNLAQGIDFHSLKPGDMVSFEIGHNRHGECANDIQIVTGPVAMNLKLSDVSMDIRLGENTVSVQIDSNCISLIQKQDAIKKKYNINLSVLKGLPHVILKLLTNEHFSSATKVNQKYLDQMDTSVVDLCSIRPEFTNKTGSHLSLPFRLLLQYWPAEDGQSMRVDCGKTKALLFRSDIETVSMKTIFSHNTTLSPAIKSDASLFFIKKLKDYLPAKKLIYLVPDWGNDFDLECIRKSVNLYFEGATPLPRSIAAVFAWQSSKKFGENNVCENDVVLVVDTFDGGISITPVQAKYQEKLDQVLPESKGISWERHPAFIVNNKNIHAGMIRNLAQDGCQISGELIQLFGFDGLVSDAGKISFVKDDNWYHLPGSIRELLKQDMDKNVLSDQIINNSLNLINRDCRSAKIFILPVEDTIKKPELERHFYWLGADWSSINGAQTLNEWQKKVPDMSLWRDHLPELSIRIVRNRRYENFYLVKDANITPHRGKSVSIPVKGSFTLPANRPYYSFPLHQGKGKRELQYVAYLKSPAFPLKEDTKCRLKMTYTYGADDPYELKFIPVDSEKAGFKSIRVEWRSASTELEKLPVPDFPPRKTWFDFQKFPKEDGTSFSNLLEWVKRDMRKISDILKYGRLSGAISHWIDKGNDNIFCFIEDTFIHKSYLKKTTTLPREGDTLSFYKIKNDKGKFSAEDVTIDFLPPEHCFLSKSLRFPALTIWNHEHSLSESDVPNDFRDAVFKGIQNAISIIQSENMPDTLKEELFFFLSCLHKDAPDIVATRLLSAVKNKKLLRKYHRNIAFAIGDAKLSWQVELLKNVYELIENAEEEISSIGLKILAVALWRSERLIYEFSLEQIQIIAKKLFESLELKIQNKELVNKYNKIKRSVVLRLELLLALLRSRENDDKNFKAILAPDKDLTKKYVTLVDDVSRIVNDSDIELKSRISLQIKKPEMFRNTPDLLYALLTYLTGDSGANSIIITGISDED
jgi:cold shock CspA family protein